MKLKTTQIKKLRTKILKISTKQSKAKLPQYKAQNTLMQGKTKYVFNRLSMNSSCKDKNNLGGNLARKKQLKTRTKKCISKKNTQHSMDVFLESSDDSAPTWLPKDKEQRNIGSPVIVEALSENLSTLSIPEVLKQNQKAKTENDVSNNDLLQTRSKHSEKEESCIIVAESLNPNDSSYNQADNTEIKSPTSSHKPQRNKYSQNRSTNVVTNSRKSEEFGTVCEESTEYTSSDNINKKSILLKSESLNKTDVTTDQYAVRFYCLRNKVVAIMSEKAQFWFTGKLVVKVIYGAIKAYGYVITTESGAIDIYSPRGYSNVSIETSEKFLQSTESDIWMSLSVEGIDRNQRNRLVTDIEQIKPGMTVILLSNLENKLSKFLQIFYPFRLFPKIRNTQYYSWTDSRRAETILQSNLYTDNYACKELIIDPRITQEVSEKILNRWRANEWSCTLIAGGKGVGKSTTTRYLINSLLSVSKMVVLVDVDPGQTECTPPGCISYSLIEQPLMGPNFTHLKTPVFQLYIGDVNVSRCITRYIEGVKILADKLSNCPILSHLPIVVNTMGFSHGIGWDIALFTIKLIRPSFLVQIMSAKPKNNYIGYLSKQVVNRQKLPWTTWSTNVVNWSQPCDHELFVVRSHAESNGNPGYETWNMEPYQKRELVMISYLSEIVQNFENSMVRYNALSLSINEVVPYVISFTSLYILIPRDTVPASHVLNVINGNIVALCGIDVGNDESQESSVVSGPKVLTGSPLCSCYGFGIVRGVDMERKELFINTPLPASMMRFVNCLVGCIPVPMTLLQVNQHNVPYTGGNNVLPMSQEHRRGYFRMRYQKAQNNT